MAEKLDHNQKQATPGSVEYEIIDVLKSSYTPKIMQEMIANFHENDIASAMEYLSRDECVRLYSLLDTETLITVLEYLDDRNRYIRELNSNKRTAILEGLETNILADYLSSLSSYERDVQLVLLNKETRDELNLITSFNEEEIGSRMSTNFIQIEENIDVRHAMRELMNQAEESDNISTIYVTDKDNILIGAIDLKDLIIARANDNIDTITMNSYPYVYSNEEIEDCFERIIDYYEDSIPVLDADNKLKGVLTSQEMVNIVNDEIGEDYARLAGLSTEEDLNETTKNSVKKRLPWLGTLLLLGFVISFVVGSYEHVVAQVAIIVTFQSLILDMAGNVGTQSLAVTVRVLMDENISKKEKIHLIIKEFKVGFVLGLSIGVIALFCIWLYLILGQKEMMLLASCVSICAALALLVSMTISSFIGTVTPIFLKYLDFDPAVASGPFITTVNDLTAVLVYYSLAWYILIYLFHF